MAAVDSGPVRDNSNRSEAAQRKGTYECGGTAVAQHSIVMGTNGDDDHKICDVRLVDGKLKQVALLV